MQYKQPERKDAPSSGDDKRDTHHGHGKEGSWQKQGSTHSGIDKQTPGKGKMPEKDFSKKDTGFHKPGTFDNKKI